MSESYVFGDSEPAVERLAMLARIFEPSTRSFLECCAPKRPSLALDLGCGPGWTTELLGEAVSPGRLVGIDISESFVVLARARMGSRADFVCADATRTPFAAGRPDLVFARLLLSHLPAFERVVESWTAALARGGVLLVEEVDRIDTGQRTFERYLALVEALMSASGGNLYLGPLLGALRGDAAPALSDLAQVSPATGDVALMFRLNLRAMRRQERLAGLAGPLELDRLDEELTGLTGSAAAGEIIWTLRQLVFTAP